MVGDIRKPVKAGVRKDQLNPHWINIMIVLYAEVKFLYSINH